jgi:LuxR family maltose regulon positive regulatory protein
MRHTKTTVPPPPAQLVARDGVRTLLDEHAAPDELGRVVLVSAPVGYGKTVAVADWVRRTPEVPTAWVSLDTGDRSHAAWWDCVLGALATCEGVPEDSALRRTPPPTDDDGAQDAAAAVLEGLDALPGPLRLVLDDVHEIVGHPAEQGLRALVRYPVPGVVLVLSSRFDAPVGVDRLRLQGRLTELRADRLRFDVEEAARLFEASAVELEPAQVQTLVDRTEGWVAALRLVALSLRSVADRAGVVAAVAGDDRSGAD